MKSCSSYVPVITFRPLPSSSHIQHTQNRRKSSSKSVQTYLLEILRVQNTRHIALLNPLQRQSSNQRRTNTRSILCSQNLDRVLLLTALLRRPIQNLAQRNSTASLEMRVLVEDRSVCSDVASLVVFLERDGGHTTGGKTCGAGTDQLGETTDEFQLWARGRDAEFVLEQVTCLGQVLEGVFFDEGEEGGVERVGFAELVDVLAFEHVHFLVLVVEGTPFAINGHRCVGWKIHVGELGDGAAVLHIGCVTAGSEDTTDLHLGVGVCGGDQCSSGVVDQSSQLDVNTSLRDSGLEHRNNILTLDTVDVETLRPALEDTVVYVILSRGVRESEPEWKADKLLITVVGFDELLKTVCDVFPEFLGIACLQILGHTVLGLNDVKFTLFVGQDDFANTEVGSAHIKGKESSLLMSVGECHTPCWVHRNAATFDAKTFLKLLDEVSRDLL